MLSNIEQIDIDLPEIQHIDSKEVIRHKLLEAFNHKKAEFLVEDVSLKLDCLNGLPGPLIKWFMKSIGNEGLYEISKKLGNNKAEAQCIFGYAKSKKHIQFFEGTIKGEIIKPRGSSGFGWDPIFQPNGFSKSFAEMNQTEKNQISMRRLALDKVRKFLGAN